MSGSHRAADGSRDCTPGGGRVVVLPVPRRRPPRLRARPRPSGERSDATGARSRRVGHAGHGAAGVRRAYRPTRACVVGSASSSTAPGARGSAARAVARAAGRAAAPRGPRHLSRIPSTRCYTTRRSTWADREWRPHHRAPRGSADRPHPAARDPARRAADPLGPRRARDRPGRTRGTPRCPPISSARCLVEAIERLQREALDSPRPQVVVKVDRSGLNEHHAFVQRLYAAVERVLRPIVAAEERRAGAHLVRAGRAVQARDQVGLRALNDARARVRRTGRGFAARAPFAAPARVSRGRR